MLQNLMGHITLWIFLILVIQKGEMIPSNFTDYKNFQDQSKIILIKEALVCSLLQILLSVSTAMTNYLEQ